MFQRLRLLSLAVGAENVDDLVLVELLHLIAGRSEVLARIEDTWLLVEDAADGRGHGKTGIGIDVDLAYGRLGGLTKLLLRNTYCIRKFSAMSVDHVNILLRNGR